ERVRFGERPLLLDPLAEVRPLDELHDEVRVALRRRARLEARDDVRVREAREDLRLAPEAVDELLRVRRLLREEELHGDLAVEVRLPALEDDAHAAAPELLAELHLGDRELLRRARA